MHIKQIIIQGFKSYKDQTVIEPFSPGLNVIVGRNGSGKSNFFAAIRFVLSDAYTGMGREERNALLHEGSGSAVLAAYVEVIFDNSDERFPTGRPELVLRRTIGMKKDEYSLDRKNATKTDVMNLLESAGFSRSNPYYIVPQGRVTTLTNMKDGERLTLLKEVAGTQVYEARRTESLKIMQETDNKRSKIDHLLGLVEERLEELEEEKDELRKYQEKDREHRCLQYTILFREQQEYERALVTIDEQRSSGVEETDSQRKTMDVLEEELAVLESDIMDSNQKLEYHSSEKERLEDERRDAQKELAKTELDVQSLTAGQTAAQATKTKHDQELKQVKHLIKSKEQELAGLLPNFNATRESENKVRYALDEAEATRRRLFTKQGRMSQFKSKRERDDYLKREVDQIKEQVAKRDSVLKQTKVDVGELENEIATLESSLADMRGQVETRGSDLQTIGGKIEQAKEAHEQLLDQRRELWREQKRIESSLDGVRQKLEKEEHELRNIASPTTIQGIKSVRRIQQQHGISGLYGTLGELFEVHEMYRVAVEATAGDSLFHYVLDNDETATKVMEILNRERSGRVTFMPLNRLKVKNPPMPKSKDAVPMMSKLKYDPKYESALQYVFGKMVICPNLEVAAQYARSHGVSGITPEGDRADKKGALTGGFRDRRKSRLEAISREARCRLDLEEEREKLYLQTINEQLTSLEPEITKSSTVVRKSEQRRAELDSSYAPLYDDIRKGRSQLQRQREALEAKERAKENISTDLRKLGEERAAYENELSTDFKKGLTSAEAEQLEALGSGVQDLRGQLTTLTSTRSQLEARKSGLEVELRENLRPRLDQLNAQAVEFGVDGSATTGNSGGRLKERQRALKRATKVLRDVEAQLAEVDAVLEDEGQRLAAFQGKRAEKQQKQDELQRAIERHQKKMEKSMQKKALVLENLAESKRGIRDLGTLPDEAFRKYEKLESDKAMKRLHAVKEALKKYSHVNKKAFEQFNNFTKQRDTLKKRRSELDSSQRSIQELIDHLDQRKDEAIERTFKQVSKEFATVFERLVPAGQGRLVIQRKSDRQVRAEEEDSDEEARETVENYTGVGISVSFNSKHDEQQRIQQLSGGQKSLCALALVFAIQQCDPAPFYLFDEIDANLDAQYRTAVAHMLKTLSEGGDAPAAGERAGGQFICTTFRPEMVLVAEKCYGVTYTNKTSSIDVVDREAALNFVDGAAAGK